MLPRALVFIKATSLFLEQKDTELVSSFGRGACARQSNRAGARAAGKEPRASSDHSHSQWKQRCLNKPCDGLTIHLPPGQQWFMQEAHAKRKPYQVPKAVLTLQWDLKGSINPVTLHLHIISTPSFEQCLYLHFSSPAEVKSNSEF